MTYNTKNYRVLGLFPSSGILENRKNDVSETGSVYVSETSCFLFSRIPDDARSPKNSVILLEITCLLWNPTGNKISGHKKCLQATCPAFCRTVLIGGSPRNVEETLAQSFVLLY
jgi:hypothetical protein